MTYDLSVKFKRDDHWEPDSALAAQVISKGIFKEDPELPESDYFYCIIEGRKIYKGYLDPDKVIRIEAEIPYRKGEVMLANAKDKKIDEVEAHKESVKDFLNGKSGIEDLLNSKSKTEEVKETEAKNDN